VVVNMPASAAHSSPLEQLIGDRMRIRASGAPSLLMTTLVGGAVGAAVGIATGDKAFQYGALGAAFGLAGSFAYAIYNAHSNSEQALAEHQALLAAVVKPPAVHAAKPSPSAVPHPHAAGWWPGWEPAYPYFYPWQ
jgi:membrane associated rhomboid family serine protease